MTVEERLDDLEIKVAYQDRLIGELDALVRSFGEKLDDARRQLEALKEGVRTGGAPTLGPANEPPPHY